MPRPLPPFRAITPAELRQFWTAYPNTDVRRLILEVERSRRVMFHIKYLVDAVHDAWRHEVGGSQSSLFALKQVMATEQHRGVIDVVPYPNVPHY